MPFEIPPNLHPNLHKFAWLLGTLQGNGEGDYPTMWDWIFLLGSISTFAWLFIVFLRVLPAISISEMRLLEREEMKGAAA